MTRNQIVTEDFIVDQIADLDGDCDVDFGDFGVMAGHWLEVGCGEPDRCGGAMLKINWSRK